MIAERIHGINRHVTGLQERLNTVRRMRQRTAHASRRVSSGLHRTSGARNSSLRPWMRRLSRATIVAALAVAATFAMGQPGAPASAEGEASVRLASAHYESPGSLTLVGDLPGVDAPELTFNVLVDGAPVGLVDVSRGGEPLSIVLVVDTSLSMRGAPISAAQDAAIQLIGQLKPSDRVALITFSDEPTLLSGFTANRAVTRAALSSLAVAGDTALYDAVESASILASSDGADASRIVLLSDGRDSGVSAASAEATRALAIRTGAPIYSFALGPQADRDYLEALSASTGGRVWELSESSSLAGLFAVLGRELTQQFTVQIDLGPLPVGSHEITLVAETETSSLAASAAFEVSNDDVLVLGSASAQGAGEPIELPFALDALPVRLRIEATAAGTDVPVVNNRILVDPWAFDAGEVVIAVRALSGSELFAEASTTVEIPVLTPELRSVVTADDVELTARVQGSQTPALTLLANGEAISQVEGTELTVPLAALPNDASFTAHVAAAGGEATRELTIPDRSGSGFSPALLVVAAALLVGGAAWLRRRLQGRVRGERAIATRLRGRNGSTPAARLRHVGTAARGTLVVRDGDAQESRVSLTDRPLTIGSAPSCDVVLGGRSVRPVHARVSVRRPGEFVLHAVGSARSGVASRNGDQLGSDWLVVGAGEEAAIGEWTVTFE